MHMKFKMKINHISILSQSSVFWMILLIWMNLASTSSAQTRSVAPSTPIVPMPHLKETKEEKSIRMQSLPSNAPVFSLYALIKLIREGNVPLVQELIARNIDVNQQTREGKTPLMWAVMSYQPLITKLLLVSGADVNQEDKDGNTALLLAARYGMSGMLHLLVVAGADLHHQEKRMGWNALMSAAYFGHENATRMLLTHGAMVNQKDYYDWNALTLAQSNGHTHVAQVLLDAGVDEQLCDMPSARDRMVKCGTRDRTIPEKWNHD